MSHFDSSDEGTSAADAAPSPRADAGADAGTDAGTDAGADAGGRDDAHATAAAFAYAIMREQYWTVRAHENSALLGDDPENLHRMRVAIRRLRAALVLFEDVLPARAASLRERLGRVGTALGELRDMDVLLERIAAWSATADPEEREALDALGAALEGRRSQARRRVQETLDTAAFRRLTDRLELFLARADARRGPAARASILDLAPEVIARAHRRVTDVGDPIGPGSPPEALHALRVRCKRLRYGVEFLESLHGRPARRYVKRLVEVQDLLGAHHDTVLAAATLRAIALDGRRPFDPGRLLVIGALIERCRRDEARARRRLPALYRKVAGKPWLELVKRMEDARSDATGGR